MSEEFDSPYFSGVGVEDVETIEEVTPPKESLLDQLKKMFPDKHQHMQTLIKTFRKCFPKKAADPLFMKSMQDMMKDMKNMKLSDDLTEALEEQKKALFYYANRDKVLEVQVANIPVFIDFAFVYFIWCYDDTAPICRMPLTGLRFKMIVEALDSPNTELVECFFKCLEDPFIKELRIEKPPFIMRTELTYDEIRTKLVDVEPLFKNILQLLLKISMLNGDLLENVVNESIEKEEKESNEPAVNESIENTEKEEKEL